MRSDIRFYGILITLILLSICAVATPGQAVTSEPREDYFDLANRKFFPHQFAPETSCTASWNGTSECWPYLSSPSVKSVHKARLKWAGKNRWYDSPEPQGDCVFNNRTSYFPPKTALPFLPFLADTNSAKFAVDNVPQASYEDLHKHHLTNEEYVRGVKDFTGPTLEQLSDMPTNLVFAGSSGFFEACRIAFARHLPLRLSPDHIWQVILHAFKTHVDLHSEELRSKFVKHKGKKKLTIGLPCFFRTGRGNLSLAVPAEGWEQLVFPSFSQQIKENTVGTVRDTVATPFSTSTAASTAAHEITLMSSMRHYFKYVMHNVLCGIPSITLSGTKQDWVDIRTRAEQLGALMTIEFRDRWMPILLPILDEFVRAYIGKPTAKFWSSMISIRDVEVPEEGGCTPSMTVHTFPYTYYTGWITNLFPYLKENKANLALQPWEEMVHQGGGHDPGSGIPDIMSSAPVTWEYQNCLGMKETFKIHFHAGFVGYTQDPDGTVSPAIGWAVRHERNFQREKQVQHGKQVQQETLNGWDM